jgi:hypothetical protein
MLVSTCNHRPILVPCNLPNTDYQVDPYVGCGHYCYYCYALNEAETDWETDVAPLIDMLAPHTDTIWIYSLSMHVHSDRNWQNFQNILLQHFPDFKDKIEEVVFSNDHFYWAQLRQKLGQLQKNQPLNLSIHL